MKISMTNNLKKLAPADVQIGKFINVTDYEYYSEKQIEDSKISIYDTLEKLGYDVEPKYTDDRADIVQNIIFRDKDKLIEFTRGIQEGSAIDANAVVEPVETPGYIDKIVMASGSFTQGSSIELSCDGPVRAPYIAYMQGALTYPYGKLGLMKAVERIKSE